jgi:hypothetical protein
MGDRKAKPPWYPAPVPPIRTCRVTLRDTEGTVHAVEIQASTLFEAAAAAVAAFREHGWAAEALTPAARLRVEVQLPSIVHEVSLGAVERWLRSSSRSPRETALKRKVSQR